MVDIFAEDSAPSLSFKDMPIGTTYRGVITRMPDDLVQMRDFESGAPRTWPDGNKVMGCVILLEVDGELRSLWATKPSSMWRALVNAQKEAGGAPMQEGGILYVRFLREEPHKNPRLNAQKIYVAKYEPPAPTAAKDVFSEPTPQAAQKPAQPAQSTAKPSVNW